MQAQNDMPFLMRYQSGWPVRDIMAQFLRNRLAKEREMAVSSFTSFYHVIVLIKQH